MAELPENIAEIESRIADLRENVRQLIEQAAADSGAADDELISERIAQQEAQLERLTKERDAMARLIRPQK
jgi:cell division protein FtsB